MLNVRDFARTLDLLDREIERMQRDIAKLREERQALAAARSKTPKPASIGLSAPPVTVVSSFTCAQAIDAVLSKADRPMQVREIFEAFSTLDTPVQGSPKASSVRSMIQKRHEAMGWRKSGSGKNVRWSKSGGPQ